MSDAFIQRLEHQNSGEPAGQGEDGVWTWSSRWSVLYETWEVPRKDAVKGMDPWLEHLLFPFTNQVEYW